MLRRTVYALVVLGFGLLTAFADETQAPITIRHVLALTRTINTLEAGNTGYILILTGSDEKQKSVVITDENVVIYRAAPYATETPRFA